MHKENEMSNRSKNIWWNLTTGNCPYVSKTELWINNKHAATLLKTHFPPFLQYQQPYHRNAQALSHHRVCRWACWQFLQIILKNKKQQQQKHTHKRIATDWSLICMWSSLEPTALQKAPWRDNHQFHLISPLRQYFIWSFTMSMKIIASYLLVIAIGTFGLLFMIF